MFGFILKDKFLSGFKMFFSKELQLALMGYSSVTTVILIILFVYIYLLKRSLNYKMCRSVSVESIKTLNRRSINNKYEVDSFTPQNTADIAKNRQSSMSVYDSAACGSVRVNLRCEETEKLTNEYEAIDENIKCTKGHQYERILESVATTLSTLYTSDKDEQDDIYDKFMVALKHRIWSKNPRLYKCLSKHHYETVLEKDKSCEDGDSTYHSFVVVQDRKSDNDNKSISTFGSSDHLKFLIESRSNENLIDTDSNYLQAKRFSARSNCPELLKELCSQQVKFV